MGRNKQDIELVKSNQSLTNLKKITGKIILLLFLWFKTFVWCHLVINSLNKNQLKTDKLRIFVLYAFAAIQCLKTCKKITKENKKYSYGILNKLEQIMYSSFTRLKS